METPNTNNANETLYSVSFARIPNVIYNCTRVVIPSTSIPTGEISTPFKGIPFAGTTLTHDMFQMDFLLNEDYSNYDEILHWMKGIGFPESYNQYKDLATSKDGVESDFTVTVNNSANRPSARFQFKDAFPVNLSSIDLDSQVTDPTPMVMSATFDFLDFKLIRSS